jgi:TetR/AcrR family transcriptional regulator
MGITERKEREKEHRREEILDAAQLVFFKKGLAVATMDEIAEAAELSKGTLYLYYKSKEDLYLAVMIRGLQILHNCLSAVISKNATVPQTVADLSNAFYDFFHDHRDYFRMLNFLQSPQLHRQASEEMLQSCQSMNHRIWEMVVDVLSRGIRDGTVRPDLNPAEVLTILWSSATALLLRIDSQQDLWHERFQIDLKQTLTLSNKLLFGAIFTETGRRQLAESSVL